MYMRGRNAKICNVKAVCVYVITTVFTSRRCVLNSVMKYLLILIYLRVTMWDIVTPYVSILTSYLLNIKVK